MLYHPRLINLSGDDDGTLGRGYAAARCQTEQPKEANWPGTYSGNVQTIRNNLQDHQPQGKPHCVGSQSRSVLVERRSALRPGLAAGIEQPVAIAVEDDPARDRDPSGKRTARHARRDASDHRADPG